VDKVEQLVADRYKTIQIPPDVRHAMLGMLDEEFAALHASSETERHQLTVEKDPSKTSAAPASKPTTPERSRWTCSKRSKTASPASSTS